MTTRRKVLSKREVSSSSEKSGGEWRPDYPAENAPLLCWPPRPVAVLEYFVKWGGFLFPWHTFYALVSILVYFYATQPLERFADLLSRPFWEGTLYVFVRNQILLWINNGFYYFILFQLRVQVSALLLFLRFMTPPQREWRTSTSRNGPRTQSTADSPLEIKCTTTSFGAVYRGWGCGPRTKYSSSTCGQQDIPSSHSTSTSWTTRSTPSL